ncbi:hypothetical protein TCAL_17433 [Tigriopus californicus]|uniref:G-protein coupled receptors family 1 profile domain-containing protein n=1 Tax=Tigriopus californicus TaxID=6832 RepID=A0A553PI31_TIGCA|nr:uncharacterized protein LOC131880342 [Tigriopus californicus]TRY77346.1 hypothetical protein TCAL_17433 [Tigriopus californicus]
MNTSIVQNIDLMAEEQLDCPVFSEASGHVLDRFSFWVEGVILCVFAVAGIIGNSISAIILSGKNMRNSFNLLLIALAIYDNTYLFGSILESFRKRFDMLSDIHILLFPYFLYPVQMIAMTGSILMTVAIALERYVAVHYPINYNLAMNDSRALKARLCRYLLPVICLSVAMNVTKFFEIEIHYVDMPNSDTNTTISKPVLNITEFRMNPTYSIYFNWFRFGSLGVIPFVLLVFFNFRIYMDIRRRRARKKANRPTLSQMNPTIHATSLSTLNRSTPPSRISTPPRSRHPGQIQTTKFMSKPPQKSFSNGHLEINPHGAEVDDVSELNQSMVMSHNRRSGSIPRDDIQGDPDESQPMTSPHKDMPKNVSFVKLTKSNWKGKVAVVQNTIVAANDARRRVESNLAAIMMGYVVVFLICHSPRLLLNIHELAIIRKAMACGRSGQKTFPLWSLVVMHLSHLLLVINSAINILIYCYLSSKFRQEGKLLWEKCCRFGKSCTTRPWPE